MDTYKAHLFICTNQKAPGKDCCAPKGAENLRKRLKDAAKERWGKDVRINSSGCLDRCSKGIAAVLYPQGHWFEGLSDSDESLESLLSKIEKQMSKSPDRP